MEERVALCFRSGFGGGLELSMGEFIFELNKVHIRIREGEDELVWVYNAIGGWYIEKLGYVSMLENNLANNEWCYKKYGNQRNPRKESSSSSSF